MRLTGQQSQLIKDKVCLESKELTLNRSKKFKMT